MVCWFVVWSTVWTPQDEGWDGEGEAGRKMKMIAAEMQFTPWAKALRFYLPNQVDI